MEKQNRPNENRARPTLSTTTSNQRRLLLLRLAKERDVAMSVIVNEALDLYLAHLGVKEEKVPSSKSKGWSRSGSD